MFANGHNFKNEYDQNDDLLEQFNQYWNQVIAHMGKDYQQLQQFKGNNISDIIDALKILEEERRQFEVIPKDFTKHINIFKYLMKQQQLDVEERTQQISKLIHKQNLISQQNQDLIKNLIIKEEENSQKLDLIQLELKKEKEYHFYQYDKKANLQAFKNSNSVCNSPSIRIERQESDLSFDQKHIKLKQVSGQHNSRFFLKY